MGNTNSTPNLSKYEIEHLAKTTGFSESEVKRQYKLFARACPSVHPYAQATADEPTEGASTMAPTRVQQPKPTMDRAAMRKLYTRFFPFGDATAFADRVFDVLDTDRDGEVGFEEFLGALATATRTDEKGSSERLVWAFCLYDIDRDGFISKDEVLTVARALDQMVGPLASTVNYGAGAPIAGGSAPPSPYPSLPRRPSSIAVMTRPGATAAAPPSTAPLAPPVTPSSPSPSSNTLAVPGTSAADGPTASLQPRNPTAQRTLSESLLGWLTRSGSTSGSAHVAPGIVLPAPTVQPAPVRQSEIASRVEHLFNLLDRNHDGKIPFAEFNHAVKQDPAVSRALNLFQGLRKNSKKTPIDRVVDLLWSGYARSNSIVDKYFPPIKFFLFMSTVLIAYSIGCACFFLTPTRDSLDLATAFSGTTTPHTDSSWFFAMQSAASILCTLVCGIVYFHKPTWEKPQGRRVFMASGALLCLVCTISLFATSVSLIATDNLLVALGDPCSNPSAAPAAAILATLPAGTGCRGAQTVAIKKTLLYVSFLFLAWTMHVAVTAITLLQRREYDLVPATPNNATAAVSVATDQVTTSKGLDGLGLNGAAASAVQVEKSAGL
ncbi:hypothetical protein H9P43_000806 [Blastocladiella emersonii ATCC 22665]|nr:hypothetical protein H9P43_000806 [Blastocladiella emersonii ATCC 22665]